MFFASIEGKRERFLDKNTKTSSDHMFPKNNSLFFGNREKDLQLTVLRPVYTGDFCRSNSMQFLSRRSCNLKIARVNHSAISARF